MNQFDYLSASAIQQSQWDFQSIAAQQNNAFGLGVLGSYANAWVKPRGPYQSDSMNRKLAKAKEWLAASKWGKK